MLEEVENRLDELKQERERLKTLAVKALITMDEAEHDMIPINEEIEKLSFRLNETNKTREITQKTVSYTHLYKYVNAQPILLLYLCYYVILICIFHFILSAKVYSSIFSIIFFKASADSLSFNASSPFKLIGTSDSTPFAPTIAGILNETPSMSYIP